MYLLKCRGKTMILRNICFGVLQHGIQNIRNMESDFPQKSHRNAWHELTISDQCVIIIGSMCERLMPGNNPWIGCTCVHFMCREERIEQRRRQHLHQAITRFVCVCGCLVFGPDLNDDVDDDGASELRSHLRDTMALLWCPRRCCCTQDSAQCDSVVEADSRAWDILAWCWGNVENLDLCPPLWNQTGLQNCLSRCVSRTFHCLPSPLVFLCVSVNARASRWSQSSVSHAKQCGNMEPSGRRHPTVANPSTGVWEPEEDVWSLLFIYLFILLFPTISLLVFLV